jgi:PAS domain S-box-containing protein
MFTMISAVSRFVVFVAIGIVVSYLSMHLAEREQRYYGLFDRAEVATFLVRNDGNAYLIEEANARGAAMLGKAEGDLTGKPLLAFWKDRAAGEGFMRSIEQQERIDSVDAELSTADGGVISILISGSRLSDGRLILTAIDITDLNNLRQALGRSNEKLNLLGSLTRRDLGTAASQLAEQIERGKGQFDDPGVRHFIGTMESAVRALRRRIELTRDYQDLGAAPPEWQPVQQGIRQEVSRLDMQGVSVRPWVERLEIYADKLLGRVFANLLENSIRHGKRVSDIVITYQLAEGGLDIFFEDNGVGIPKDQKTSIFEYGADESSSGLGLFLSREILGITGMRIEETGEPGVGARFVIHVPPESYRIA